MKGHKEAISTVQWTDDDEILSASWDHTLKIWDIEYGAIKSELVSNKSIFHANQSSLNGLIVTCGADRYIRLYDPKSNGMEYSSSSVANIHRTVMKINHFCVTQREA